MASASELVYDRLVADEKLTKGRKYERLAALVYKVMIANADVVHHVVLRATGKAADHEIDVAVTSRGTRLTMLIECRDRGRKVIEGEVRDFFGKLHHLNPDVGVLLSPQGFTRGAVAFANDEGIVLAEFRPVRDTDSWVESVRVEGHLFVAGDPTIGAIQWADDQQLPRLAREVGAGTLIRADPRAPVLDRDGNSVGTLLDVFDEAMKSAKQEPYGAGMVEAKVIFPSPLTVEFNGVPSQVSAFDYQFEMFETVQVIEVKSSGVAEMLLRHVTGPEVGEGQIFFDDDFKALTFDEYGRVVPRQR